MTFTLQDFKISEPAKSMHYLVVGHPVGHSISPEMHGTALEYYQIPAGYYSVDVRSDQISDFAAWCNRDEFCGCNITIPYKKQFMDLVDQVDPIAEQMGVINTIVKKNHKLIGYNTDAYGFIFPLKPYLKQIEKGRVIIFGTGGASKAVAFALSQEAGELIFVSRNPDNVVLPKYLTGSTQVVGYAQWQDYADDALLFVNTTPVGMHPHTEDTFLRNGDSAWFEGKICYDLVYNPPKTLFLKRAESAGATCINGLPMLIHQGSRSFELWTGKPFPVERVEDVLKKYF